MRLFTKVFAIAILTGLIIVTATNAAANTGHPNHVAHTILLSTTTSTIPTTTASLTSTTIHHRIVSPAPVPRTTPQPVPLPKPTIPNTHDYRYLAPCITGYESGGGIIGNKDYLASNPFSTASGEAQWLDSTWNNYGGYKRAKYAPPSVQDQRLMEDLSLPLSHIQKEWAAQRSRCHF